MDINGNLVVGQSISGRTLNLSTSPATNNSSVNLLIRNSSTGNIEQRTAGYQAQSTVLDNWAAYAANGIVVWTSAGAWSGRTLTAPAAGLSITNPNGVAGNPTFALANDLSALEGLGGTGLAVRTGTDTWAQRTITAGSGISVTNGNGVSGNVSISLPSSAVTALTLWSAGTSGGVEGGLNSVANNNSLAFGGTFASANSTSVGNRNVILGGFGNTQNSSANDNSAILGGAVNTITTGALSGATIIGGNFNSNAQTNGAIIGGRLNSISTGSQSVILGGNNNSITGSSSSCIGSNHGIGSALSFAVGDWHRPVANALASTSLGTNTRATAYAELTMGSGNVNGLNAQNGFYCLNIATTNATQTSLQDGAGNNGIELEAGYSYYFNIVVHATIISATNQGSTRIFEYKVKAKNQAGTSSVVVLTSGTFSDTGETGTGGFALTQNTITSKRLQIRVTGANSTTVTWQAMVTYTKVRFNTNA